MKRRFVQQPAEAEELILRLLSSPALGELLRGFVPSRHARELHSPNQDEPKQQAATRQVIARAWATMDPWDGVCNGWAFLDSYMQQPKRPWDLVHIAGSGALERYCLPSAGVHLSCGELVRRLAADWGLAGDTRPVGKHYNMILIRGGYAWSCFMRATAVARMISSDTLRTPLVVGIGSQRLPERGSAEAAFVEEYLMQRISLTEAQILGEALRQAFVIDQWRVGEPEGLDCGRFNDVRVVVPARNAEDGRGERLHAFLERHAANLLDAADVRVLQVTCPPYRLLRHLELLRACQLAGLDWKVETVGIDGAVAAEQVDPLFANFVSPFLNLSPLNLMNEVDAALVEMSRTVNAGFVAPSTVCSEDATIDASATVRDLAQILGRARVLDGARVSGSAEVSGDAVVSGRTTVTGHAWVRGQAKVTGNVRVEGFAVIEGEAEVNGNQRRKKVTITGSARVCERATVSGNAHVACQQVGGQSWIYGDAWLGGSAQVGGGAMVAGRARVLGRARVEGEASVHGDAVIDGAATVTGRALICGDAHVGGQAYVDGRADIQQRHHVQVATLPCGLTVTVFRVSSSEGEGFEARRVFVQHELRGVGSSRLGQPRVVDPGRLDEVEERAVKLMEELVLAQGFC